MTWRSSSSEGTSRSSHGSRHSVSRGRRCHGWRAVPLLARERTRIAGGQSWGRSGPGARRRSPGVARGPDPEGARG
eukprot:15445710-Alexandrium_andersonii.AAC.1